jgi:beta-lactamase class D
MAHMALQAETTFLVVDGKSDRIVYSLGPFLDRRVSPCSTFKIPLCLMGFDAGILHDADHPQWTCPEHTVEFECWKGSHSPETWMKYSVVWYSKRLALTLGPEVIRRYLSLFSYGNQDIAGEAGKEHGFVAAHLSSSLRISPREEVAFLCRFLAGKLPLCSHAVQLTRTFLYMHTLPSGWRCFGKTGSGYRGTADHKIAWYVGWLEKEDQQYVFALLLTDIEHYPTKEERQALVQRLLHEGGIDVASKEARLDTSCNVR